MKGIMKKTAAAVMAAMTLQAAPFAGSRLTAHADGEWSKFSDGVTTLGTSVISAPKAPETETDAWTGSYVYYGQYGEGEKRKSVKYRVLDTKTSDYGGTTMFLDCDTTLFTAVFRANRNADDGHIWAESDLYKVLNTNDDAFLKTSFTGAEAAAITESTRESHPLLTGSEAGYVAGWTQYNFVSYTPLTGEKIFVLDVEDASNSAYGYSVNGGKSAEKKILVAPNNPPLRWWLRSPNFRNFYGVGYVDVDHLGSHSYYLPGGIGVTPAFNIDLSSIVFSSQVNEETGSYGREYKLTLKDDNTKITPVKLARYGNTFTVKYTVTDSNANDGITADTATVLILDRNNEVKYYAPLKGKFAMTGGSGTFELPADYSESDSVYILAEDVNARCMTDYASSRVKLNLAEAIEQKIEFTTNSMTLGGAISLNFYIDLSAVPEDYLQYSYVEFEVNGRKQTANFNPNKTNKAGAYGFNCVLNSISMADDVKATLHYYDVNADEKTLTHTASCETYLNKFNENFPEATWNIIKAINDYGYYMQQYLSEHSSGSWTLGVDHKAMEKSFKTAKYYAQKRNTYLSELKKMKVQKVWGTNSDIDKVNYSLVLDSNTAINFKITKKEGYTGKFEVKLDGKKVTPKKIGDNRYQVTAGGISAHLLAEPHTVTVTTDHGTSTYTASALSYAFECLAEPHYDSEISAFGALYEYYKATIAYKAAL